MYAQHRSNLWDNPSYKKLRKDKESSGYIKARRLEKESSITLSEIIILFTADN